MTAEAAKTSNYHRKPSLRSTAERNALVVANQGLVHAIALRMARSNATVDDLVSAGQFGLIRAAELYDPTTGFKFTTYATPHVIQAIQREMPAIQYVVRVPVNLAICLPAGSEVPKGFSEECIAAARRVLAAKRVDWSDVVRRPSERRVGRREREGGAEQSAIDDREEVAVAMTMAGLTFRQKKVLRLRYGLDGKGERALRDVGEVFGVTAEAVRRWEKSARETLRSWAAERQAANQENER